MKDWQVPALIIGGIFALFLLNGLILAIPVIVGLLSVDLDGDGLSGAQELLAGTGMLKPDSDGDGLKDGLELKLGTDPRTADSDHDGLSDNQTLLTLTYRDAPTGASLALTGKGDAFRDFRVANDTSEYYGGHPARRGPCVVIYPGEAEGLRVTLPYDEGADVNNSLALCYFNDSVGMYLPADSLVDTRNHTVTAAIGLSEVAYSRGEYVRVIVLDLDSLFQLNRQVFFYVSPEDEPYFQNSVHVDLPESANVTTLRVGENGQVTTVNRTIRFIPHDEEVLNRY